MKARTLIIILSTTISLLFSGCSLGASQTLDSYVEYQESKAKIEAESAAAKKVAEATEAAEAAELQAQIEALEAQQQAEEVERWKNAPIVPEAEAEESDEAEIEAEESDEAKTGVVNVELANWEITWLALAMEHEIGSNPSYYASNEDFEDALFYMAVSIINRIGKASFSSTLMGVLNQDGQYPGLVADCNGKTPKDETVEVALDAVNAVNAGNVTDVLFEMSFSSTSDPEVAREKMAEQVGNVSIAYYTYTADGRLLVFAEATE